MQKIKTNRVNLEDTNTKQSDLEAYVKTNQIVAIISTLEQVLGKLQISRGIPEIEMQIFENANALVCISASQDEFLSIWIRCSEVWHSHAELGRYLAQALDCLVRCDPGAEYPEVPAWSSMFLEIDGDNEKLIDWD